MSYGHAFQRVVGRFFDDYHAPKKLEINGTTVYQERDIKGDVVGEAWIPLLEELFPTFNEIGWLDGVSSVQILEDMGPHGRYHYPGGIDLDGETPDDDSIYSELNDTDVCSTVGSTKKYVLVHEMIHHAHLYHNEFREDPISESVKDKLAQNVSDYANSNQREAIAEIGTGITLGRDYPEWVHEYYESLDGPQAVYELRDESI